MKKSRFYILSLLAAGLLFACGGGSQKQGTETKEAPAAEAEASAAEVVADSISLEIEGNDQMQYNTDELKVTEGQVVTLTLKHVGQMPKEAMGHNWVLLKQGTEIAAFGNAAVAARETNYIPQDMVDKVIANTIVVGGGEQASVTFEAPKAGYYKFICSFPGHYSVMQGTFVVQPR